MAEIPSNIFVGNNSLKELFKFSHSRSISKIFVLADENTRKHCYPKIKKHIPAHTVIKIKSAEKNKTLATCELIWEKLTEQNADRKSLVVNLGGGVIGDVGGFAAGCYKRGIKFINLPTTLLAMVDASVGGKTGIDFHGFKNQIGLFNEPQAVFIYTAFLKTLPDRELLSGFAEVIKHYLIADKTAFKKIKKQNPEIRNLNWDEVVLENVKIKSAIVEEDPHEDNIRKALNFGHTIGHALESYFLKNKKLKLLHGEAIAIGIICESFISKKRNLISEKELKSISKLILHYFKLPLITEKSFKKNFTLIKQDKKNSADKNQFTLLKGIGNYTINNFVEEEIILKSFRYYNSLLT